jgi:hypothetical protein
MSNPAQAERMSMIQTVYIDPHDVFAARGDELDEDIRDMLGHDGHAEYSLLDELADGLWGEDYSALAPSDHRLTRLERALVRYPLARRPSRRRRPPRCWPQTYYGSAV